MYTPIELDKIRNFQYGMQALCLVEKKLKCNLTKIDWSNLSIEQTANVMWAGLVHEDNKLTPDKIMELIDKHSSYKEALEIMSSAVNEAFGKDEEEEKNE